MSAMSTRFIPLLPAHVAACPPHIPFDERLSLRQALGQARVSDVVVVYAEESGFSLEWRIDRAERLYRDGDHDLAVKVATMALPPDHALVYVDFTAGQAAFAMPVELVFDAGGEAA